MEVSEEPSFRNGEYKFLGQPCPTQKVFEILGESGVNKIDQIIKSMQKWKEIIYGKDSIEAGFHPFQIFKKKEKNSLKDDIYCMTYEKFKRYSFYAKEIKYAFPERNNKENYFIFHSSEDFLDDLIE